MGMSVAYQDARAEGNTITLSGFTLRVPGEERFTVGDLVFEGIAETPDGAYTADRASVADVDFEDGDVALRLVDIHAEGIVLPAEVSLDSFLDAGAELYRRISAGPLTVTDLDGNPVFGIDLLEMTNERAGEDGGIVTAYSVAGIWGDLSRVEDHEVQEFVDTFDMAQMHASLSGSGTWWPQSGRIAVEETAFHVDNLGGISMSLTAEGYTEDFYRETIKINHKLAEMMEAGYDIDGGQMQMASEAILDRLSEMSLVSTSLRYEDDSLFMKVLDMIGAEEGVDGETMKAGLKFMVPMALAELDDEDFKTMVRDALNAFVDDPRNVALYLEPEHPIDLVELGAIFDEVLLAELSFSQPSYAFADLVDLLGVRIVANQ
jgi:hypothetical protein